MNKNPAPPVSVPLHLSADQLKKLHSDDISEEDPISLSLEDIRQLIHDQRVLQIELDMKNEELRQARQALDTSRTQYEKLYDQAPVGYITVCEKGCIRNANLGAAAMLQIDRHELVGESFSRFVHTRDRCQDFLFRQSFFGNRPADSIPTRADRRIEVWMVKKGGDDFWCQLEASPMQDDGEEPGCRITMLDITECKQTSELLDDINERYMLVFDGSGVGIWDWDIPNRRVHLSRQWKAMRGYTDDEIGESENEWNSGIYPDDFNRVMDSVQAHFAGKTAFFEEEYRVRCKNGTYIWILDRGKALTSPSGQVVRMAGSETDITARKLAEDELRLFKKIIEMSPEAVAISDASGHLRYINPAHEKLFGYALDEARKRNYRDYYPVESVKVLDDEVLPILAAGGSWQGILDAFDAAGCRFPLWEHAGSIHDVDGKLIYGFGFMHDETDRILAEKAQWQIRKTESLGRMAGAIAHYFNNQLCVVTGGLELLLDDQPIGSSQSDILINALHATHKSAEMSALMLDYLGQSFEKKQQLDLSEICHKGLLAIHAFIPKQVSVLPSIPFPGPRIEANIAHIQRIVATLVTNAWESIPDCQGTITIRIQTVNSGEIPSSNRFPINWKPLNHPYACLDVTDTGQGIENEDIEKIFDPFFTTKFMGRGLGLSIVLGIVGAYGGGISVESVPGRGSVFKVFFPLIAEASAFIHRQSGEKPAYISTGNTVLLIDDERMMREMTGSMLQRLGYSVLEAEDGLDAVAMYRQHRSDICMVLSDLTMPRMNGWETLTALRGISPGIPVILSSGYDESSVMPTDTPDRPDAFLAKPYLLKDLRDTIGRVLRRQSN